MLGPFWDPSGIQNEALERPGAAEEGQKGWYPELGSRSRLRLGRALCAKGVPRAIRSDLGTPLGDQGALSEPPWVTKVLIRDPLG